MGKVLDTPALSLHKSIRPVSLFNLSPIEAMSVTIGTEADAHDYRQVNEASWDARAEMVCHKELKEIYTGIF